MSQYTATRRRRAVAYADSRPLTGTNSAAFALTFLLVIGCVTDVQGVALLPLLVAAVMPESMAVGEIERFQTGRSYAVDLFPLAPGVSGGYTRPA